MRYITPRLILPLFFVILLLSLGACANPPEGSDRPECTTEDLRAHYDTLVVTLQGELAALRTDTYITTETLLARIEALEAALKSLGVSLPDGAITSPPSDSATDTLPRPVDSDTQEATAPPPESSPIDDFLSESDTVADTGSATTSSPETADTCPAELLYVIENGTATVTGCRFDREHPERNLSVPATLGGYPVTRIADNAFEGASLESVTLPASVTRIGWFAFLNCDALRTVTLPASVKHIDYGAFDGCPRLTIYCPRGSYAARYATASALPVVEV